MDKEISEQMATYFPFLQLEMRRLRKRTVLPAPPPASRARGSRAARSGFHPFRP